MHLNSQLKKEASVKAPVTYFEKSFFVKSTNTLGYCQLHKDQPKFKCGGVNVTDDNFSSGVIPDSKLDQFLLVKTRITIVKDGTFKGKSVKEIKIYENKDLTTIEEKAFEGIIGLQCLTLDNNRLYFNSETIFIPFASLDGLEYLSLRGNNIQFRLNEVVSDNNEDKILPMLRSLDLSENPLGYLDSKLFAPLEDSNLDVLSLTNTNIEKISKGMVRVFFSVK